MNTLVGFSGLGHMDRGVCRITLLVLSCHCGRQLGPGLCLVFAIGLHGLFDYRADHVGLVSVAP